MISGNRKAIRSLRLPRSLQKNRRRRREQESKQLFTRWLSGQASDPGVAPVGGPARVGILGSRLLGFLSLLRSLNIFPRSPTTCIEGCILSPFRDFVRFAGRRRVLGNNRALRTSRC